MVMETEQTSGEARPLSQTDFDTLRSLKDREIAELNRALAEERALTDEKFQQVADYEARLARLEERGYEDDDPRTVEVRKELVKAKEALREAKSYKTRADTFVKDRHAETLAFYLARADGDLSDANVARRKQEMLSARTMTEMNALYKQAADRLTSGRTPAPGAAIPAPPERPEVDAGRGGGRSGAPRLSWEGAQDSRSWQPAERAAYMKRIDEAMRRGDAIPAR